VFAARLYGAQIQWHDRLVEVQWTRRCLMVQLAWFNGSVAGCGVFLAHVEARRVC